MKHKKFESLIVLEFYEEISPQEKAKLEQHLSSCLRCGGFQKSLEKIMSPQRTGDDSHLDKHLLEARDEFHRVLLAGRNIPEYKFSRPERRFVPVPVYAVAVIAFVMLVVGATTSFLFFGRPEKNAASIVSELNSKNKEDIAIDNIRFLSTDQGSGEVQFSFDFVKRYEMKGSLDDQSIQTVLAYALINSDNPGVRLKTVGMLETSTKPDKEIEKALLKAAKSDDNAGVRRQALLSLKKLPFDNEIRDALLFVLQSDKNPGMRVSAINYLSEKETSSSTTKTIGPNLLNVLRERSLSDQNKYVRLKAASMLKEITEL
jgi:hypothetical protein